jgi:hypothetical protein
MTPVEKLKLKAEHAAVVAAQYDLEFRFEQMKESLDRLEQNIEIQKQKASELEQKIKGE